MSSPFELFVGLTLGLFGGAYLLYGWRQRHVPALACGAALSVAPMVEAPPGIVFVVGIALIALPFFVRTT